TWSAISTNSLTRRFISDPPRPPGRSIHAARIRVQSGFAVYPQGSCAPVNHGEIEGQGTMSEVTLSAGPLRLQLSPSIGGAISAFEWIGESGGTRPILRKCHTPLEKVLEASCFPLVPYVNRIRGGRFTFRGREVRLAPNMAGDPSPLHGQGWLNPWRVERQDETSAVLTYRHEPG